MEKNYSAAIKKFLTICDNRNLPELRESLLKMAEAEGYLENIPKMSPVNPRPAIKSKQHQYEVWFTPSMKHKSFCKSCSRNMPAGEPGCRKEDGSWIHLFCASDQARNENPHITKWINKASMPISQHTGDYQHEQENETDEIE